MMKTFWVVIISAGLGIALGVGTGWARVGWRAEPESLVMAPAAADQASGLKPSEGLQPKVVVDAEEHDFGPVAFQQTVQHAFRFSNEGEGPLRLESGGTSCHKCTVSTIPTVPIAPGQTGDVVVSYYANADGADFRQSATILTNDPMTPRIELTVSGKVVVPVQITPNKVVLSGLAATETRSTTLSVVAFLDANFKINSSEFTDSDTARFFEVDIQPLSADEVASQDAKCGFQIALTVKPGMPLGPLRQTLVLQTNLPDLQTLQVPIEGSVDSDISIAGASFDRDTGLLNIGPVDRRAGAERSLAVLIHGQQRHAVHVTVGKCDPPLLQVTLGEPADLNSGAVVQIPLVVKIPRGSPPSNYLLHYGKILLETNHPDAKQIRIWVKFAVED